MGSHAVPAVVLGAGGNGLGVARSLARAGVPVWLLDSDPTLPAMRSRVARPLRIAGMHGDALITALVELGDTTFAGQRPVLLLTQEASVKAISQQRERLAPLFRFNLPPAELVEALQHKHGFQMLAERLGAPIPPLVHVRSRADFSALEALRYPVVVKPGERNAAYSRAFKKAYRVEGAAPALELLQRILPVMPDVVVQEWIDGPDAAIYFCLQYVDRQGTVAASFTGRKIRSWPPQVGGTASCTAAFEAHGELSALTARFFRDVGVTGMASMEYKRDARTGAFRMVEPTIGRTDYQEEVATLNGANLPYAAYCAELGLPVPQEAPPRWPVVWRSRSEDLQSAAAQGQGVRDGMPRGSRSVDALFRWHDPAPAVAAALQHARRALARRLARLSPRVGAGGGKS